MSAHIVALLADRREEIKAVSRLFQEMLLSIGGISAARVLGEAIRAEARAAGRRAAPNGSAKAGLSHYFKTFENRACDGGMGELTHEIHGNKLTIVVGRCDYYDLYHASELPDEVASALCCGRESEFARGYDVRLRLVEKETREERPGSCRMVYNWDKAEQEEKSPEKVTLRVR